MIHFTDCSQLNEVKISPKAINRKNETILLILTISRCSKSIKCFNLDVFIKTFGISMIFNEIS